MVLRETGLRGVDWIRLAQDRYRWRAVVGAVMKLLVIAPRSELVNGVNFVSTVMNDRIVQ
jgi:hypothetical protein